MNNETNTVETRDQKTLEWLNNSELGYDIWTKKYQRNNETFDEWILRVSGNDPKVAKLIREKKFLFGGRILANRGIDDAEEKVSLSNCYVITPPEDNLESIYETCFKLAKTYSRGGGCGIDISKMAPRGAKVRNQARTTSGSVSFMDTFSQVTGQIGQAGRRGALMISIDCSHPDLEEFIEIKNDLTKVTFANISVRVSDDFMKAVANDQDWELYYKRKETGEEIKKVVSARKIFKMLCRNNWDYAEPGILFWDNIQKNNLLEFEENFEYAGTNPCAEEPLPAGGSCLLGSINLSEFVTSDKKFNFDDFCETVRIAVRALNTVLDEGLPKHPLKEQRETVRDWRQIGLGIFGLADMLIKLEIPYGSKESLKLCDKIGHNMAKSAIAESVSLAQLNGSYPKYSEKILESSYFKRHTTDNTTKFAKEYGLYNSQLLTIAPTGTLSTMLGVSGGIEPIFANSYTRLTKSLHNEDVEYKVYTPIVEEYMQKHGLTEEEQLPNWFVTSGTIEIDNRIAMQSIWQKHIDASISSTVNLPNAATVEDVEKLYMHAWQQGLKGITVFRDGCSRAAILSTPTKEEPEEKTPAAPARDRRGIIKVVDDTLVGKKRKLKTGCGNLHCEAFFDPSTGELMETFFSKGSAGGCNSFMVGLSRMISLCARAGVSIDDIIDQLSSTLACPSYAVRYATKKDTSPGNSCPAAIGRALREMYDEMQLDVSIINGAINSAKEYEEEDYDKAYYIETLESDNTEVARPSVPCPECGEDLLFEGGCNICKNCGYSKCE